MADPVRDRWSAGEVALNGWSTFAGASAASALAAAGYDAVTVDLQHGEHTVERLGEVAAAIERAGAVPFVRLGWNDPAGAMRVLDLGARGVICPMVDTAAEAAAFVRVCRYPPLGARSYGPVRSAFGTGREQTDAANTAILAFAQIETAEGWANVESICATPGLDGVYVGPADLSLTLGFEGFADLGAREMLDALDRVVAAASAAGIVPGIHAPSLERATEMARRGFRFVGAAGDAELLRAGAAESLERIRAGAPPPG
ncbi:MAG TPA: aldolase/citrate lyase family protein [Actinomycetota bacterium]|nr:aldolase/citrate lyase family protein [Actinomycetota bacterium]